MQNYLNQLHTDIAEAIKNLSFPFIEKELSIHNWMTDEEENKIAPVRNLQKFTGIYAEMLPSENTLTDTQVQKLCTALIKLLNNCNCHFVLQLNVPIRIQYETIRQNFDQDLKLKQWHMGFFDLCKPNTLHKKCALGEYCHCTIFEEVFKDFVEEDLSPKEERARALAIEINYLKRKYEDDWIKYYPYHLDAKYDDENGNPHNYGLEDDDEEEEDNWWKK